MLTAGQLRQKDSFISYLNDKGHSVVEVAQYYFVITNLIDDDSIRTVEIDCINITDMISDFILITGYLNEQHIDQEINKRKIYKKSFPKSVKYITHRGDK